MVDKRLPFAIVLCIALAAALPSAARADITLTGTAALGPNTRTVTLVLRCGVTRAAVIDADLVVPAVGPLKALYDFDSFEGPYAKSSTLPLSKLESSGGAAAFVASGAIPVSPADGFRFTVASGLQAKGKPAEMARVLRPVAASGGVLTWTQGNPARGRAALEVRFEVLPSAAAQLLAALGPCLGPAR